MEISPAIQQSFVNGASPLGPADKTRAKQSPMEDDGPARGSRSARQEEESYTNKIDKSGSTTPSDIEAPAQPAPSDSYAFFLQQKNFAYLPINTPSNAANQAYAKTETIEQKDALPIATFLQIANPRRDVRLIDTYV